MNFLSRKSIQNLLRVNRGKRCPEVADNWVTCIQNKYNITRENKLRQFYFKLLHRIPVTNKELTRFGMTDCEKCVMCGENDSIEHAFFECQSFLKLISESLQWFIVYTKLTSASPRFNIFYIFQHQPRVFLLYAKQYHYACKIMQKKRDSSEFISKFIIQLEIHISLDVIMLPSRQLYTIV